MKNNIPKKRLFLIDNSPPNSGIGGGTIIREKQKLFFEQNNYEVWQIFPNVKNSNFINIKDKQITFSINIYFLKLCRILQKANIIEDYLSFWIKKTIKNTKGFFNCNDTLFCISGGELSSIILGSKIKKLHDCFFIVNFHDPILNTKISGDKIINVNSQIPQKRRDIIFKNHIYNSNYLITSSKTYYKALKFKYPYLNIDYNHFGFSKEINRTKRHENNEINILYGGSFSKIQKPEILIKIITENKFEGVKLFLIGDHSKYRRFDKYKQKKYSNKVVFVEQLNYEEFMSFVSKFIDIGFVSIDGVLSKYCVPSKIYEYINLEIPILGVAEGDALEIINSNKIGYCSSNSEDLLKENLNLIIRDLTSLKINIAKVKPHWSFEIKYKKTLKIIKEIHG